MACSGRGYLVSSSLVVLLLLGEDDEQFAEEGDEVDEQIERVVDEVTVTHLVPGANHLRVVTDEARHHNHSAVQRQVREARALNDPVVEHVGPEHGGQTGEEHGAEIEERSLLRH